MPLFFVRCRFFVNTFNRKKSNFDHFDQKNIFWGWPPLWLLLDTNILLGIWAKKLFVITRITSIKINRFIHSCSCILVIYFYSSLLTRIFLPFLCFLFRRLFHHCCRFVEQSFQTLSFIHFLFVASSTLAVPGAHCFTTQMCGGMQKWVYESWFFSEVIFSRSDEPWICIRKRFMLSIWPFTLLSNLRWRFFARAMNRRQIVSRGAACKNACMSREFLQLFGVLIGWTWWVTWKGSAFCRSLVWLASRSLRLVWN